MACACDNVLTFTLNKSKDRILKSIDSSQTDVPVQTRSTLQKDFTPRDYPIEADHPPDK